MKIFQDFLFGFLGGLLNLNQFIFPIIASPFTGNLMTFVILPQNTKLLNDARLKFFKISSKFDKIGFEFAGEISTPFRLYPTRDLPEQ